MAVLLEANYGKKLGLPGYSSHQYSVTVRTELADLSQVEPESRRLYSLLQQCVDQELRETGLLPGREEPPARPGPVRAAPQPPAEAWNCSPKQSQLLVSLARDLGLSRAGLQDRAQELFGSPVERLNRVEASKLIDDLIASAPNGAARESPPKEGALHARSHS